VSAREVKIVFQVTVTYATARTAQQIDLVDIQEYDPGFDDTLVGGLAVTTPAGSTTGSSERFELTCTVNRFFYGSRLVGPNGASDLEEDHEIYAEFQRYLFFDVESPRVTVNCQGE
jgi:hypothetical protein